MIEDARSVDDLPSKILVVKMPNEKRLCCERIRLDVDVRAGDFIQKGRLAHVRITAKEERSGVRVDRRKASKMLANLLEIGQRILLPSHDCCHPSESSALELFASVEAVTEFEQADVIFGDVVDEVPACS